MGENKLNGPLVSSEEAMEYMKQQQSYDKNQGNILDKSDEWYYSDKTFVSNSQLSKLLSGGPQHLKAYYEHGQKETPARIFGRAQNYLLFEPVFLIYLISVSRHD